jgi:hypothetical protein
LTKALLSLSDQLLVTYLAILTVAIVKMPNGSLTAYHFAICLDLASFSNGVHSMTLIVLTSYFCRRAKLPERASTLGELPDESGTGKVKKRRLPLMTSLRVVLMSICDILLIFSLVILGYRCWYDVFRCPVACVRKDIVSNYGGEPGAWSTAMIISCLTSQLLSIMSLTNSGAKILRDIGFNHMPKLDGRLKPNAPPGSKLTISYTMLKNVATHGWWWVNTIVFSVATTLFWFALGVWMLFGDWAYGHNIMENLGVENTELQWGFGQFVPLIFCVLLFIVAGESYWGKSIAIF